MAWNEKLKRDIPASWKTVVVDDVAEVFNGATPSTGDEQNYGGDIVWITPKDLSDQKQKFVYQGERNISQAGYDSCSTHLLPINTVLMSSRAPIGLLAIAKKELCTNQGFKSFVVWTFQPQTDKFPIRHVRGDEYLKLLALSRLAAFDAVYQRQGPEEGEQSKAYLDK